MYILFNIYIARNKTERNTIRKILKYNQTDFSRLQHEYISGFPTNFERTAASTSFVYAPAEYRIMVIVFICADNNMALLHHDDINMKQ